ncbi:T9SS type A sorting domain-containing protein [Flavobacteriales bacterium]|nr:T9SS type A sorting domain-containing protein [Flavobacteriales bacterium]
MKKNLLFVCLLVVSTTVFAQSRMANTPNERIIKDVINTSAIIPVVTPSSSAAAPITIWDDDFSNAANWIFTNTSVPSLDWHIEMGGDPAIPTNSNGPTGFATVSNGYLFIDSDGTGGGDNDGTPVVCEATTAQMIDCSAYPYVQLTFSHNYRWWKDTRGVRISADNGATWTEPQTILYPAGGPITDVNSYPILQNSGNPEVATYDISAIAGGKDSVLVQFYYDDNDIWAWYWAVDDVSISEIPDNGVAIQDEVYGGWWVNYLTAGGFGQDYTYNPMAQVTANPYAFEAVIKNTGIATQAVTMYADVSGPSASSHVSNTISLAVTEQDTFVASPTFTPTMNGVYTIDMWGVGDSAGLGALLTNTDITTKTTEVTDNIYGKDMNSYEYAWRLSRSVGGSIDRIDGAFEVGADYDIYANVNLYSIDVFIADWSIPGTKIYASLYEIDADPQLDPIPLWVSGDHTVSVLELGAWINIPFGSAQSLIQGTAYCISIGGYIHPTDSAGVGVSGIGTASSDRLFDKDDHYQNGAPSWYTIGDIPMLRMNFDSGTLSAVEDVNALIFNVYPNPTNGVFTIELAENVKYKITIKNILGQIVYSSSINTLSTTIDLSVLDKGIYTIELKDNNTTYTEKVIVE